MADEIEIVNVGGENGVASEVTLERLVKAVEKMAKSKGLDPKETTKALKDLNKEIEDTVDVVTENRDALEDHTEEVKDSQGAIRNFGSSLGSLALNITGSLLGSIQGLATQLISGGDTLSDFAQHVPIVGSYLTVFTGHLDSAFESFRDLSSSGASFNNSMQEMMLAAAQSRMGLAEFGALVSRNTEQLAAFGGTVTQGAKTIGQMQQGLGGMRENLLNMGFTFEEINEGLIQYQFLNRAGSRAQQRDQAALAQSAGEYLQHLGELSKLTGQSVDSLQDEMQQRSLNSAFQMKLAGMDADQRARVQEGMATALATGGQAAADRFMQMVLGMGPLTDETRMLAAAMPEVEEALRRLYGSAMNASSSQEFQAAQTDAMVGMIAGALDGAEDFETAISAAAAGMDGPSAALLDILNGMGVDFSKYAGLQGRALEDAIRQDIEAAQAEQQRRGELTQSMARFNERITEARRTIQEQFISSGIYTHVASLIEEFADLFASGGMNDAIGTAIVLLNDLADGIFGFIKEFQEAEDPNEFLKEKLVEAGQAIASTLGNVLSEAIGSLWENSSLITKIAVGAAGLFAAGSVVRAVTNGISGLFGGLLGRRGADSDSAPSRGGRRGGGAGASIGRGIGQGVGGIVSGVGNGLAAVGAKAPLVLLGASAIAGAIAVIGAGIAGATWLMGAALPTLSEGMKSFEDLDGSKLVDAGAGMAAVAGGMAAFGAGSAISGLGNLVGSVTEGLVSLFGGDTPMEKMQQFAEYDIDAERVRRNAEAMVAFGQAMAVQGAGAGLSGVGNLVSAVGDFVAGIFGGDSPIEQVQEFGNMDINAEGVSANAAAMVSMANALGAFSGQGIEEISIPRALVNRFEELAEINGTGFATTAAGLQSLANITGLTPMITSLNSLDVDNLTSYNRAMEDLVETLQDLNEELSRDNNGIFSSGTGTNAGTVIGQAGSSSDSGMTSNKLDQLNNTMIQATELLTEIRDSSKRTSRNLNNMGQVY